MRYIDPVTFVLILLLFFIVAVGSGYLGYSYRGTEDCHKAGGTQVRTSNGYVCAKLEVITP